jgi:hypothetical protein
MFKFNTKVYIYTNVLFTTSVRLFASCCQRFIVCQSHCCFIFRVSSKFFKGYFTFLFSKDHTGLFVTLVINKSQAE